MPAPNRARPLQQGRPPHGGRNRRAFLLPVVLVALFVVVTVCRMRLVPEARVPVKAAQPTRPVTKQPSLAEVGPVAEVGAAKQTLAAAASRRRRASKFDYDPNIDGARDGVTPAAPTPDPRAHARRPSAAPNASPSAAFASAVLGPSRVAFSGSAVAAVHDPVWCVGERAVSDATPPSVDSKSGGEASPAALRQKSPRRRRRNSRGGSRPRIALVSIAAPAAHGMQRQSGRWMLNFTIVNKMRYAATRGYDLHIHGAHSLERTRTPTWSKLKLVQRYLLDYDYVVWVDGDTLFTNFSRGFEEIVAPKPYDDFFAAKDGNGLNAGVLIFKQTARAAALLDMAWRFDGDRDHQWQDQHAISETLTNKNTVFADMAQFVSPRALNAYPGEQADPSSRWQPGDLLVHFVNCDTWAARCWDEFRSIWREIAGPGKTMGAVTLGDIRSAGPGHVFSAPLAAS